MPPRLRTFLYSAALLALACWMGTQLATESYALPGLILAVVVGTVLGRLGRLPVGVITLGFALFGYIVGNRGFAQLMPAPGLPLLPAEICLLICGTSLVLRAAFARRLPLQRDWLNRIILAWLVVGTARVAFDVPVFGFNALRDYAMIYYAGFFFIAQEMAGTMRHRNFLVGCLVAAGLVLPPVYYLTQAYPDLFFTNLAVRGVPLVYFKDDLAATFFAAGALILFFALPPRHRAWGWPVATLIFLAVLTNNNRASVLGAVVALGWLLASRRWIFPVIQLSGAGLLLALLVGLTTFTNNSWAEGKVRGFFERMTSLSDIRGQGIYQSDDSFNKGDNNRFRLIWWRTVVTDVREQNPLLGLGFGYDLAHNFVQEYNMVSSEEFTARSPHSIAISAVGRMGAVGALVFVSLVGIMAATTRRALRRQDDPVAPGLWTAAWVILVSACFGVVLEGPMGAVVFWSILGLANGTQDQPAAKPETTAPLPAESAGV